MNRTIAVCACVNAWGERGHTINCSVEIIDGNNSWFLGFLYYLV